MIDEFLVEFPHSRGTPVYFVSGRNQRTGKPIWRAGKVFGKKGMKYQIDVSPNRRFLVLPSDVKLELSDGDEVYSGPLGRTYIHGAKQVR